MDRTLALGTGLLAAVVLANAGVSYRNTRQLDEDARWVAHTHEVIDALDGVAAAARMAAVAARAYRLAGDPADLSDARAATAAAADDVELAARLTADNPRQQARVPALRAAVAAEVDAVVRAADGPDGGGDRGLAEAVRTAVDGMIAEERDLLREREAATRRTYRLAVGSGAVAAALGLAAVAGLAALIARHHRAAADLAAERERYRATFEQAAVGVAHVAPDGRWLRVNRRLADILGYPPEELARLTFQAVTDPDDLGADLDLVRRLTAGEIDRYALEKRYVRKDGARVWAALTVALVRRPDGRPDYFISVVEDISARKALEEEVRGHAAELERRVDDRTRELRDANDALEAFAHSVAHDLRAPLRNMQALAAALVEDHADRLDPEGRGYADGIARAGREMDRLIVDLLAFSRLSRAEVAVGPVDLDGAAADAVAGLGAAIRSSGGQVTLLRPMPPVVGHRPTLVQVVTNLVENALKFVRPGVPPDVRVWAERRGDRVRVWVEDTGIGVAPEHRERIFRVFERLHGEEAYPGTGIGLAIVRKGAERTGGRCGVEARPGGGSRFWVEWPAYRGAERAGADGPVGGGQPDGRPDGHPGVPQGRAAEPGAGAA
jgi:PAS domain S-box-containing protein